MPSIFNDERRGHGPIGPDPFGTGRFFAHAASRPAYVGLPHGASRSYRGRKIAPATAAS